MGFKCKQCRQFNPYQEDGTVIACECGAQYFMVRGKVYDYEGIPFPVPTEPVPTETEVE